MMTKTAGYLITGLLIFSALGFFGCGGGGGGGDGGGGGSSELSILSTTPGSGATGVAVGAHITVTFNSNINASTLNASTFTLTGPDGLIDGSVSYNSVSKTSTFTPSYSLPPLTQYTATLTTGVRDTDGNTLSSPYSWSFTTVSGFWAYNFVTDSYYFVNATKVAEGDHCYVYLEQGQSLSAATVTEIVNEFDNAIYAGDTTAFGSEPDPGVDGDSKIYLLLLDIKDGFNGTSNPTYIAGYYDPENEYIQDQFSYTNLKEMFFMDIYPADPGTTDFYATIAHEFQHMIHWEQKTHLQNLNDDTWLDESMSTVARTYCGLGTDTVDTLSSISLLTLYEERPFYSLTNWDSTVYSYAVAYMWAQYFKDRFDPGGGAHTIFWWMIHNDRTGINSVNTALTDIGSGKNFTGTFRDWTVANAFGNTAPSGHPEWSYASLTGWPGIYATGSVVPITHSPYTLSNRDPWSADYFVFTPTSGTTGTITWTRSYSSDTAALIDTGHTGGPLVYPDLTSGTTYDYTGVAHLIEQNPWGSSGGGDAITYTALRTTPRQMLDAAARNPVLLNHYRKTGRPAHICVDSYFRENEMELRAGGARPHFRPQGRR
jgi:hypothetical protein